ncbi:hypothetical protein N9L68_02625 [bacterium]|nr:hypothetical protein [bacterium]
MKMETRPNEMQRETRPNETSIEQKICLAPDLGLGDSSVTWRWCNSIVAMMLCLCFFQGLLCCFLQQLDCRMIYAPLIRSASSPGRRPPSQSRANQMAPHWIHQCWRGMPGSSLDLWTETGPRFDEAERDIA